MLMHTRSNSAIWGCCLKQSSSFAVLTVYQSKGVSTISNGKSLDSIVFIDTA